MYFEKQGRENTEKTVQLALAAARENKIGTIVAASSRGGTARLLKNDDGIQIICVTHAFGYPKAGENEMSGAVRAELAAQGISVLTCAHALSGAERGISRKFSGVYPVELISHTLRFFGQGTKVCVEIAAMAADAGLVPYHTPIIAVGGSGAGADTALLLTPAYSSDILDTKVHEIICKPRDW